jgi:hypothetical protein
MTWSKDLNVPETFGFLKNQVTPFSIDDDDDDDDIYLRPAGRGWNPRS